MQADLPRPTSSATWRRVDALTSEQAEKRGFLLQIAAGMDAVDAQLGELAQGVRLRQDGEQTIIDYEGQPLSQTSSHLLRAVDWSLDEQGGTRGVLNRSVVVQFALWALTDNYTELDLARRLHEPQFAFAQPREASIRWSVRHLLKRSGLKPQLFDAYAPEVAYNNGVDYLQRGDWQQAEVAFFAALERRPDYPIAVFNLALTYSLGGQWDRAQQAWRRAAQVLPEDPDTWYNLGAVTYRIGEFEQAADQFAQALEIDSSHADAIHWLPRAQERLHGG